MLYSLRNSNKFNLEDQPVIPDIDPAVKQDMRSSLEQLNSSLWLSELASCCDLVIPLDKVSFGEKTLCTASSFSNENYFQKSALYSLALDNLVHPLYSGKIGLKELVPQILYSD